MALNSALEGIPVDIGSARASEETIITRALVGFIGVPFVVCVYGKPAPLMLKFVSMRKARAYRRAFVVMALTGRDIWSAMALAQSVTVAEFV